MRAGGVHRGIGGASGLHGGDEEGRRGPQGGWRRLAGSVGGGSV